MLISCNELTSYCLKALTVKHVGSTYRVHGYLIPSANDRGIYVDGFCGQIMHPACNNQKVALRGNRSMIYLAKMKRKKELYEGVVRIMLVGSVKDVCDKEPLIPVKMHVAFLVADEAGESRAQLFVHDLHNFFNS